ncbi:MAG: hypothetical protein ACI9XO_002475 [Paraglaciecola sp.]|jgi:uncharacterized protein (TIGR02453 family)
MMNTTKTLNFLQDLQQNNSKDWMDANRSRYHDVRDDFLSFIDGINSQLVKTYPQYLDTPAKKAIERINNNLMFHPERPTYKDHFGATLDKVMKGSDYYISIGLQECFIAGGMWHPNREQLRSIREAIDYNGTELRAIIEEKTFKKTFGALFQRDTLKTAPQSFDINHPHIDLLRLKSFAVIKRLTLEEVRAADFEDNLVKWYAVLSPFLQYLRKAMTV